MKTRIYLDTSVFSALLDERVPERRALTLDFWSRRSEFDVSTSERAREELGRVGEPARRSELLALLGNVTVFPLTAEMEDLADHYISAGVFTAAARNDAVHVAAAVLTRQDILLSWNFRHMVNRLRRARVNAINMEIGLPALEILAPPEV